MNELVLFSFHPRHSSQQKYFFTRWILSVFSLSKIFIIYSINSKWNWKKNNTNDEWRKREWRSKESNKKNCRILNFDHLLLWNVVLIIHFECQFIESLSNIHTMYDVNTVIWWTFCFSSLRSSQILNLFLNGFLSLSLVLISDCSVLINDYSNIRYNHCLMTWVCISNMFSSSYSRLYTGYTTIIFFKNTLIDES